VRKSFVGMLLVASVCLTGCVTSKWGDVQSLGAAPLSAQQIRERFAGNTLAVTGPEGRTENVYVTSSMQFVPVGAGRERAFSFDMIGNGLMCMTPGERRFCYRVYEKDGRFLVVSSNGEVFQRGQITQGNQFGV